MVPLVILYVEDDPDDIQQFHDALNEIDATINFLTAQNGEAALKLLSTITPDIIFMDNNMPRIRGIDCLRKIRSNRTFDSVPVVMYSTSEWVRQPSMHDGADYFLRKDISFNKTVADIREALIHLIPKGSFNSSLA